jgi:hypothetical protein
MAQVSYELIQEARRLVALVEQVDSRRAPALEKRETKPAGSASRNRG